MSWNKNAAVDYLQLNARPVSRGECARYVREAIERGGIVLARTRSAKDYGLSLAHAGFRAVSTASLQKGDVIVIDGNHLHPHGHMAMYDGQCWISDFKQWRGFYPGPDYRSARPDYKIYRHD
ncbi:NlpC/P60 family protein [Paraburkholderia youngii]|uniref:NlpC/P60 family protein n=1 Tax=Paraburkholderia youngii TaxID=2782701 RepID=UPI003D1BCA84